MIQFVGFRGNHFTEMNYILYVGNFRFPYCSLQSYSKVID